MWLEKIRRQLGVKKAKLIRNRSNRTALAVDSLEIRDVPAMFTVTTLADTVAVNLTTGQDAMGNVSLRSAIQAADATPGGNTIELSLAGTYSITLPGTAGETDGLAGEFAILPNGGSLSIQNTSGGTVVVNGNHLSRVFDINPQFDSNNPTPKYDVSFQGFTIENGFVTDAVNADGPNASGGGIRDQGNASLTLTNMVIANNVATADGGGVSMENTVSVPWTLTLNNTTVTNNHAGDAGGGIESDGSGKVFVTGGLFSGNSCVNQGGGIWLDAIQVGSVFQGANLTVSGTTFTDNQALNGPGGGIGNAGNGAVSITDSAFTGNAGIPGGGFGDQNAQDSLTIQNSTFTNNNGTAGGGISFGGPTATITSSTFRGNFSSSTGGGLSLNSGSSVELTADLVAANTATTSGGGIAFAGTLLTIANSQVQGNSSAMNGGGILANGTTLTIQNSTIAGNTAAGNGGAIELQTTGSGSTASSISNTTISDNSALNANGGNDGGGIDASTLMGSLSLLSDTIHANFSNSGGGIFWSGTSGSISLQNSIIAGNSASATGPDVINSAGMFSDLGGNLIGNSTGSSGFASTLSQLGSSANPISPLLGSLQANGGPVAGAASDFLTLNTEIPLAGSPAIGRGILLGSLPLDERGFLRPAFILANGPDVGAVDSAGSSPQVSSTVPLNGDVNPYGVGFVPASFPIGGAIQPGDLLIANFNNAGNTQGTGTSLIRIAPGGTPTTVFTSTLPGVDAALGFLKAGYILLGNVPNTDGQGTPGSGAIQVIDSNGNLVTTFQDSTMLDGPWYLTIARDTGSTAEVFVSNVLSGTVTRLDLAIGNGTVTLTSKTEIAGGYGTQVNPNVFVAGPAVLAYNSSTDTVYVASEVDDTIFSIANASTVGTTTTTGAVVIHDATHLHGPLGLLLAPNGNLIVANADSENVDPNQPSELVEYALQGQNPAQFVGQFSIDANNGGAFGLGLNLPSTGGFQFAAVDDNGPNISLWGTSPVPAHSANLQLSITPASSTVVVGGNIAFTLSVTNTGTAGIPADGSSVSMTLPQGLTTTNSLTFAIGSLPVGHTETFTVNATATSLGTQTVSATITSPDTTPTTSGPITASITVITPTPVLANTAQPLLIAGQANGSAEILTTNSTGQYAQSGTINPFGTLTTDIRTAVADVNGDGVPDYIVATGPGVPFQVAVVNGKDGSILVQPFSPFAGFTGGGFVSAGDFLQNGRSQIVVSPDRSGGPRISIFDLNPSTGLTMVANFFTIDPNFRGGARTAVGDLNGDGVPDLVVAAGFGGGPVLLVIDGKKVTTTNGFTPADDLVTNFYGFSSSLRDGAYIAVGDVLGNGQQDLILGPGDGGPSQLEIISGKELVSQGALAALANPISLFTPTGLGGDGAGLRVAAIPSGKGDQVNVAVGTGRGRAGLVSVYPGTSLGLGTSEPNGAQLIQPFDTTPLTDGIFVG